MSTLSANDPEITEQPVTTEPTASTKDQPAGYVSEESYKGLQRAAEKQRRELETKLQELTKQLEGTSTELEAQKLLAAEKVTLQDQLKTLATTLDQTQKDREVLNRTIAQQNIILGEFPTLAPLAGFIPTAPDDDTYRSNAKNFEAALSKYVTGAVKQTLEGASPPSGKTKSDIPTAAEEDKAWNKVYSLAGVPGKEKEYEEAYAQLRNLIGTK